MKTTLAIAAIATFLSVVSLNLQAHEQETHYNRISLSASAAAEVQQDELQASLYATAEDKDARASADSVSHNIRKALDLLDKQSGISVQTGSYNTQPVYNRQQIVGWRTRQTLALKSSDSAKLSSLLGQLQTHVQVEHIGYGISDDGRAKAEDVLIREALNNFTARAQLISQQMGSGNYRLVDMNLSTSHQRPMLHRAMVMSADAEASAAPPIQAGTQRVEINVNGTIEIQLKP